MDTILNLATGVWTGHLETLHITVQLCKTLLREAEIGYAPVRLYGNSAPVLGTNNILPW